VRDATARAIVGAALGRTRGGEIEVVEGGRSRVFGRPSELRATVRIKDPAAWRGPLNGSIGMGESYVDGLWETDDLVALIQIIDRSLSHQHLGLSAAVARSRAAFHRVRGLVPENTKGGARANISAHYDLGNDLFASFLDPTMMYSCAWFPREDATLEEAQLTRLDRICERLQLGPDTHLLEIGTGWGGMAIHAAHTTGCRVTTTTISQAQHELASERVRAAGLEDRITILLEDYRDLTGTYDRLVSLEMIEAVGWQYFDTYFQACDRLLADDGVFLLQAITIDDRLYEIEKASKSFANTHVFPGGCLPSLKVIADCVAGTSMREVWLEDITAHYPPTLAEWRRRFFAAWGELSTQGYDERFKRLWDFYLSGSEAGFRERRIGDVQLLFAKPAWR
jgi:cyclopropane-fatty-acyl-phospholipid synthase